MTKIINFTLGMLIIAAVWFAVVLGSAANLCQRPAIDHRTGLLAVHWLLVPCLCCGQGNLWRPLEITPPLLHPSIMPTTSDRWSIADERRWLMLLIQIEVNRNHERQEASQVPQGAG
jgi:hypothetical protein